MRILVLLLFLLCVNAHAIFVSLSVNDSRLQTRNWVYKPSGMIGFSVEAGFFNEPENMIDYKLSVGIKRFGYSFDDGNDVVSFWGLDLKPCTWSFTYRNIMFELYPSISWHFAQRNLNNRMEEHGFSSVIDAKRFAFGYGYRLGYNITKHLLVALYADYKYMNWDYRNAEGVVEELYPSYIMGGWGLSGQWNF